MKKGPLLIVLMILVIIAGFAYFRLVLLTSEVRPIHDAIPESAPVIFEFRDFSKTKAKLLAADYGNDLLKAGFIHRIVSQLDLLNTHFSDSVFHPVAENELSATLHLTDIDNYDYLYLIDVSKKIDRNRFKSLMLDCSRKNKMKQRTFKDVAVYDFYTANGEPFFTLSKLNGIMMASQNASLVEEAIIQLKEKTSLLENKYFNRVRELAGGASDVLLYLNFKNLISLEPLFTDDEKNQLIKHIALFSEWMENDIMLEQKSIIINGYTLFSNHETSWISQFAHKPAEQLTLPALIPEESALFMLVSCKNVQAYFDDLKKRLNDSLTLRYATHCSEWTDNEWVFGLKEPLDHNWKRNVFLIVKHKDSLTAVNKLAELSALATDETAANVSKSSNRLSSGYMLNEIYGKYLLPVYNPYYAVAGNYTVFASDSAILNYVMHAIENNQTLGRSIDYINFSKNISATSNLYVYIHAARLSELLYAVTNKLMRNSLHEDNLTYQRFSPASVQFTYEENLFFSSAYINYRSSLEEKNKLLWKLQIDTVAATTIRFVLNHHTKESEVTLQDARNQLYLISRSGSIIWKKQLNGRIISDIKQIDFYNNGRLQLLFNTARELIVTDREGNYLTNFPLRLPDKATAGMLLAHYKDVNLQRIFIPCHNRIYGYEISGKPLQGWNPLQGTGNISFPLQHHVFEGRDYLIALNDDGKIFIFDRKGNHRTAPVQLKEPLVTPLYPYITGNTFELAGASKNAVVYKINHLGHVKEIIFSEAKGFTDFCYLNVTNDVKPEYVFIYTNKITAYDDSLNVVLDINIPDPIDGKSFIPDSRNKSPYVLGLPSQASDKTFILKSDGTMFDDFVINGFTPFDVDIYGKEKRNTIVTCNQQGMLHCYRLD